MTQRQLVRAVAGATGESVRTIRSLGFGVLASRPARAAEDLDLVLDCPFCGRRVPYPGDGDALAECLRCDVYFDVRPGEVYLAGPDPALAAS
jgi:hypothetical protein